MPHSQRAELNNSTIRFAGTHVNRSVACTAGLRRSASCARAFTRLSDATSPRPTVAGVATRARSHRSVPPPSCGSRVRARGARPSSVPNSTAVHSHSHIHSRDAVEADTRTSAPRPKFVSGGFPCVSASPRSPIDLPIATLAPSYRLKGLLRARNPRCFAERFSESPSREESTRRRDLIREAPADILRRPSAARWTPLHAPRRCLASFARASGVTSNLRPPAETAAALFDPCMIRRPLHHRLRDGTGVRPRTAGLFARTPGEACTDKREEHGDQAECTCATSGL